MLQQSTLRSSFVPDAAAGETMMEQVSVEADDERFEPSRSAEANPEASSKVKSVVCYPSVPSNGGVKPKSKKDKEGVPRRWIPLLRRPKGRWSLGRLRSHPKRHWPRRVFSGDT